MNKVFKYIRGAALILAVTMLAIACYQTGKLPEEVPYHRVELDKTLLDLVKENPNLSVFYALVMETGFDAVLKGNVSMTVLAPVNNALTGTSGMSKEEKLALVQNHVAYVAYNSREVQSMERIRMANRKNLYTNSFTIDPSQSNILCLNGTLHVIDEAVVPTLSIDEFLRSQQNKGYMQVDTIYANSMRVMDMDKSTQIGVNESGQAVYDTVWTTQNVYLEAMPIANEDSTLTFALLTNENFSKIKAKYAKYMKKATPEATDQAVTDELIRDLVFRPNSNVSMLSGVAVDFSGATVVQEYKASNGLVRILNGVDVKLKENKIKTIIIEAEDYQYALQPQNTHRRMRAYASGGTDIYLKGRTTQQVDTTNAAGVTGKAADENFYNEPAENNDGHTEQANFCVAWYVKLYSLDYDVYWLAYDDRSDHVNRTREFINAQGDTLRSTFDMTLAQKLFVSMPDSTTLSRGNQVMWDNKEHAIIRYGCFGDTIALGEVTTAGVMQETRLQKWVLDIDQKMRYQLQAADPYVLPVPSMGQARVFCVNSPYIGTITDKWKYQTSAGGIMTLDYIKFVPRIDDGD